MTDWSDAEISRRLALAIGWRTEQMLVATGFVYLTDWPSMNLMSPTMCTRRMFDYRDPAVYAPIAERFDCFPYRVSGSLRWYAKAPFTNIGEYADTAAKAVALAVIKAKEHT